MKIRYLVVISVLFIGVSLFAQNDNNDNGETNPNTQNNAIQIIKIESDFWSKAQSIVPVVAVLVALFLGLYPHIKEKSQTKKKANALRINIVFETSMLAAFLTKLIRDKKLNEELQRELEQNDVPFLTQRFNNLKNYYQHIHLLNSEEIDEFNKIITELGIIACVGEVKHLNYKEASKLLHYIESFENSVRTHKKK